MDTPLQQRIVGAIVLVALGVIFIPALLDGSGYKSRHVRSIEIPARPVLLPVRQETADESKTPLRAKIEQQRQQDEARKAPPVDLKAWMVQVGTFENGDNARNYRDELRAKGYTTHVIEQQQGDRTSYRVRIGPEVERERIEALKDKLQQQGIEGYIVAHG